jgi:hypothetical protein
MPALSSEFGMDHAPFQQVERPRKRGRPLTSEEKWMVHHVFETVEKEQNAKASIERDDPYSLTSK